MKKDLLLPHRFQKIGWIIFIPTLLLGILTIIWGQGTSGLVEMFAKIIEQGRMVPTAESISQIANGVEPWLNNVIIVGILTGSIFITCSRERVEDEMIGRIRLNALLLALYTNFTIVIIAALTVYELRFVDVMIYNLFTLPLLFLIIYKVMLWRLKHSLSDEE